MLVSCRSIVGRSPSAKPTMPPPPGFPSKSLKVPSYQPPRKLSRNRGFEVSRKSRATGGHRRARRSHSSFESIGRGSHIDTNVHIPIFSPTSGSAHGLPSSYTSSAIKSDGYLGCYSQFARYQTNPDSSTVHNLVGLKRSRPPLLVKITGFRLLNTHIFALDICLGSTVEGDVSERHR